AIPNSDIILSVDILGKLEPGMGDGLNFLQKQKKFSV
ncbi:unnamed protein product, partial [marine sediment metagenome]